MANQVATVQGFYGGAASFVAPTTAASSVPTPGSTGTSLTSSSGAVPVTQVAQNIQGSILAQPIMWLFGLVLFLVAWKLIEEHRGGKEGFQKIKVDGTNIIKVGIMATIFLIVARYFAARYTVPGLSSLIVGGT